MHLREDSELMKVVRCPNCTAMFKTFVDVKEGGRLIATLPCPVCGKKRQEIKGKDVMYY